MKKIFVWLPAIIICLTLTSSVKKDKTLDKLGWKLGVQAYSFKNFTFSEALNKINSLGLDYVEGYRNQELGNGLEGKMDFKMPVEQRQAVLDLLKQKGITMLNFGVVTPGTEEDWRALFEFAKAMGIQTINSEPKPEHLDLVSDLCDEFNINLAIHNHPKPSIYWSPESVLEAVKGRSNRMGACADVGHWVRSGLDPVECIKKLEGNIKSLHFKDLNEKAREAHDVPWGTGVTNIAAVMKELKNQKFKGVFSVEYEYNWDNSVPEIAKSVKYFKETARKL